MREVSCKSLNYEFWVKFMVYLEYLGPLLVW